MSDIFEEAEEGLRQDRWATIAKKSAPWVGGALAVALIGALGFWGYTSWETSRMGKASETYVLAQEALTKNDKAAAKTEFQKVVDAGAPGYKALALSQLAGLAVEDNKADEAVKLFDEAAKASSDPLLTDLATLKATFLLMDKVPFADVEKRLTPLTKEGRPYAALAKEALAMAKIQKGDLQGARGDLQALAFSLDASDPLKQRAQMAVALIDSGGAEVARQAVKLPEVKAQPQMAAPLAMPQQ
ncbi:tetratricopeptide repeat protein [Asticcacaulis sp. AND118]|uniref:tetratricopeptide repeat protein n=1 Tax=Asticcacaulis sp. AND118 TaxID=2840468 RepID=UPI001CFF7678|nr:tetratricopeptide repeat protein [Asticcacaulis sp. AND118]UDF02507.1 tetratricopeptide repeat protein [Asticcacaulis sp. AND118]